MDGRRDGVSEEEEEKEREKLLSALETAQVYLRICRVGSDFLRFCLILFDFVRFDSV